ncbi:7793_t:CDS:2 [Dentiscutata erythropus]|uniref:7793_t:CDS:1 n=1 Tax=Dentiscutata erythropus TaxID=1348616 RepID=A0A9N9FEY6_9GLOM|nr:7793_t:CDS:2 [Dentiscutata erythropus]
MQSFLSTPNFNKTFFYKEPQTLYKQFCNAFAYYKQVSLCNLNPNRQQLIKDCNFAWKQIKKEEEELSKNAVCQCDTLQKVKSATKKISEYEQMFLISMDELFKETLVSNIVNEKKIINEQETQFKKLKHHFKAQAKLAEKKVKLLNEGIVEKYEGPGRLSAAMIHSDF